jgi:hypothetical protein
MKTNRRTDDSHRKDIDQLIRESPTERAERELQRIRSNRDCKCKTNSPTTEHRNTEEFHANPTSLALARLQASDIDAKFTFQLLLPKLRQCKLRLIQQLKLADSIKARAIA